MMISNLIHNVVAMFLLVCGSILAMMVFLAEQLCYKISRGEFQSIRNLDRCDLLQIFLGVLIFLPSITLVAVIMVSFLLNYEKPFY